MSNNTNNLWYLARDNKASGGWIVSACNSDFQQPSETYAKYKIAQAEALKRNSNEILMILKKDIVTDFGKDEEGNAVFWLGSDYEEDYQEGHEGWLLCDNVPFKANAEDFVIIENDDGELILKPTQKLLAIKKYQYFNIEELPDNVQILDSEYDHDSQHNQDYIDDKDSQYDGSLLDRKYVGDSNYRPLLNIVTKDLYRKNPFRILGLPINASLKEINRKQKSIEMSIDLGTDLSQSIAGILPLEPSPDKDRIKIAAEQIRDPHVRLIYGLFWFWQSNHSKDECLELLHKRKFNEALKYWHDNEGNSNSGSIAKHNMAVLYHLTALDLEDKIINGTAIEKEIESCKSHWKSAYTRWFDLVETDLFGDCIIQCLEDIDDVRLTLDIVDNIRHTLPKALLNINAELAVDASYRCDSKEVERHINIMNASGFDDRIIQEVIRDATRPIIERIHSLCSPLTEKAETTPKDANSVVRTLLNEIKPLLKTLDLLMPEASSFKERCHDEVAAILRCCIVIYGNETADWKECLSLSNAVLSIAANTSMIDRIEEDIAFIKKNIETEEKNERLFGSLKPIDKAPSLNTINGIGCTLYGSSDHDYETHSYLTTYYFVILAIPIFPICRYRVIPTAGGYRFLGKAPLRTFDKWHLAISIGVIAVIVLSIMLNSGSGYSSSSSYSNYKTNNRTTYSKPSTSYTPQNSNYSEGTSLLLSQINTGKQQLKAIESELKQIDSTLESLSSRVNSLKLQIDQYESTAANGQYVNQYSYNSTIENHNKLVNEYNSVLSKRKIKYSEYEQEFKRVNGLIERYNRR